MYTFKNIIVLILLVTLLEGALFYWYFSETILDNNTTLCKKVYEVYSQGKFHNINKEDDTCETYRSRVGTAGSIILHIRNIDLHKTDPKDAFTFSSNTKLK